MDWTFLEQYTKQAKLLLRVLSLLLCGVTFFTATVPGWFAEKYEGLPADTAAFSTVPVDADPAAPHLHFAIFELGPEQQWWKGTAINPYPRLRGDAR